ncbi:hypothetical protein M885DRAFT_515000 [Pelagophyceae sp. CCMP2097]|nr:hypothetical protein M885DRAFT_515000 [Pelagophyceae sp. CCMP2097]
MTHPEAEKAKPKGKAPKKAAPKDKPAKKPTVEKKKAAPKAAKKKAKDDDDDDDDDAEKPPPPPGSPPEEEDDGEPKKVKKLSGYFHFCAQKREEATSSVNDDSANAEMTKGDKNKLVTTTLSAMWKALSNEEQQVFKDEAPDLVPKEPKEKKEKKATKAKAAPKEGEKKKRDSVRDVDALKAKMDEDGWEATEKERTDGKNVDKIFSLGKKKYRSLLEVARNNYPDLVDFADGAPAEKPEKKQRKADKPDKSDKKTSKSMDDYYLGDAKAANAPKAPAKAKADDDNEAMDDAAADDVEPAADDVDPAADDDDDDE